MGNIDKIHSVWDFFNEYKPSLEDIKMDKVIQNIALPIIGGIGSMSFYAFQSGAVISFPQMALIGVAAGVSIYAVQALVIHILSSREKEEVVLPFEEKILEEQIINSTPVESINDYQIEDDNPFFQDLSRMYQEIKQWVSRNLPDRENIESYRNEAIETIKARLEKMPTKEVIFKGLEIAQKKAVEAWKSVSEEVSKRLPTDEQVESTKKLIYEKFSDVLSKEEVSNESQETNISKKEASEE